MFEKEGVRCQAFKVVLRDTFPLTYMTRIENMCWIAERLMDAKGITCKKFITCGKYIIICCLVDKSLSI